MLILGSMLWAGFFATESMPESAPSLPLVSILIGGGLEAEPKTRLLTVFADGTFKATESPAGKRSASQLASLKRKLLLASKVSQISLDSEILKSGVPAPSMRNDSARYGLELRTPSGTRVLHMRAVGAYRTKGLPKVDAFLAALDAAADYGGIQLKEK